MKRVRYATGIIKCPTGVYAIAGGTSIDLYGQTWPTEQEAIDALLSVGITEFQLSNCQWHKGN